MAESGEDGSLKVVLSDLLDTDNPLSSIKTFDDLNLSVFKLLSPSITTTC